MTFAKGASLDDPCGPVQLQPRGQHQAGHRLPRGREIDEKAFKALIKAAVALNESKTKR